ncbi:MAG: helix-turn-helix transcriptional regulator [Oscillospiraceae bacterium]|nr:helix-turn-helix transcriptional regulator [Oscillospiraceae bacterium]
MYIVDKIFNLLKEKQLTQKNMAETIGVSTGNISDWKSGKAKPSITVIPKIADFFNVSIDYLYGRTENPEINK